MPDVRIYIDKCEKIRNAWEILRLRGRREVGSN